jgi:hypothetical protein
MPTSASRSPCWRSGRQRGEGATRSETPTLLGRLALEHGLARNVFESPPIPSPPPGERARVRGPILGNQFLHSNEAGQFTTHRELGSPAAAPCPVPSSPMPWLATTRLMKLVASPGMADAPDASSVAGPLVLMP